MKSENVEGDKKKKILFVTWKKNKETEIKYEGKNWDLWGIF